MATENVIVKKSFEFAVDVVRAMRILMKEEKEFVLSKQLMRSSTSVGANVEEGCQAQSKKDFIHKLSIANKEAFESRYWLKLMKETEILDQEKCDELILKNNEVIRILVSIIKTSKLSL